MELGPTTKIMVLVQPITIMPLIGLKRTSNQELVS